LLCCKFCPPQADAAQSWLFSKLWTDCAEKKNHDLIRKKDLYKRFGVKEYHAVDPDTKLVLTFELVNGKYEKAKEAIGKLSSNLLQQEFEF